MPAFLIVTVQLTRSPLLCRILQVHYSRVFLAISMYADYAIGLRSCSLMITARVNKVNILDNLMLGEEYLVCELIDRARDHFLQRVLRWRL